MSNIMLSMLSLYRRHVKGCPHKERHQMRCQCPVWVDGIHDGKRTHHTLDTRDMVIARRMLARFESEPVAAVTVPPLSDMVDAWLSEVASRGLAKATIEKHLQDTKAFRAWAEAEGITEIAACDLPAVRRYRDSWNLAPISAVKRLERTRQMWRFWIDHSWTATSPPAKIKPPKTEPKPKKPYEEWEISALLSAVENSKRMNDHERRRMTAFLHVLRFTGLRISDAVQLEPRQVRDGRILLQQAKTAAPVHVPVPALVVNALEAIRDGSRPYFWSGAGTVRTRTANYSRALSRIGRAAGVTKASPHRFRTTFAVWLLSRDVPPSRVAKLLGHKDSTIVEKHYAPWVSSMQDALDGDVRRAFPQEYEQAPRMDRTN